MKSRISVLLVGLATVLLLAACVAQPVTAPAEESGDAAEASAQGETAVEETAEDAAEPMAAGAPESSLVSTEWLSERLDDPSIRLIEVSVVPGVYEQGHIPGAVSFRWHTDLMEPTVRDIVTPERFTDLVQTAGVNQDSTVILYGDNNNWFAAWGAWVFTMYGAEDVRLLDGGRAKWEAEGRQMTLDAPSLETGDFTASFDHPDLRAHMDDVLAIVEGDEAAHLLDIRGPAEFNGEIFAPEGSQELSIRAGHIPGAVNMPWSEAVNEDGTFKSVEELRELYASIGVDGSQPAVVYCRIGERASHTWFVLHQLLGYDVALYDGSWTEWGNTVGAPIENVAGTVWGAQ